VRDAEIDLANAHTEYNAAASALACSVTDEPEPLLR
jgi:hypothetical protein